MLDFNSSLFKGSLCETIAWSAAKLAAIDPAEWAATRQRRTLLEQSGELMRQAHEHATQSWFRRDASKTKEWRRAMAIVKEVRVAVGSLETRFRGAALKPNFAVEGFGTHVQWAEEVAEVVARRSRLLSETARNPSAMDAAPGRLLLYVPAENLADGAAEVRSDGFFDVNNVPPWDLWIHFSDRTLVSWVPQVLVEAVQFGISVNPEGCIFWAD